MTPTAILSAAAQMLWGERWPIPAAKALEINPRTMQRIRAADAAGEEHLSAEPVLEALESLLERADDVLSKW